MYGESTLSRNFAYAKNGLLEMDNSKYPLADIWGYEKLIVHHIDGNHFNNTLDNLQILCPNCHSIMGEHTANRYYKNNKNATMMELEDNCLLEGQAQSVRVQIPVVAPKKICKCCGAPIKKNNKTNLCKNCYNIYERYVDRPNRDILKQELMWAR